MAKGQWLINGRLATEDEVSAALAEQMANGEEITSWCMRPSWPWWHLWRWPRFARDYLRAWCAVRYMNAVARERQKGPQFRK